MIGNTHDKTILETLVATTCDSVEGYRDSAERIDDPILTEKFQQCAQKRNQVLGALQDRLVEVGGEKREEGTILGSIHRGFLGLKDAVTGSNPESIVNEVKNGETYLQEKFDAALKDDDLTMETRAVITRAASDIAASRSEVSAIDQVIS